MKRNILLPCIWLSAIVFLIAMPDNAKALQNQGKYTSADMYIATLPSIQKMFYKAEFNKNINVEFRNEPIEQALRKVALATGLKLTYRGDVMVDKRVTLHRSSISISDVLTYILEGTELEYMFSRDGYLLIGRSLSEGNMEVVFATVRGKVSDAQTGETLPGVNVLVKGTTSGTATNARGEYELTVESLQDTLIFSFIGYESKEVPINGRAEIDVVLEMQTVLGSELVVVGYSTQSKTTLTGSVSNVKGDQIKATPVANITNSIAGNIAGVSMRPNGGQPGRNNPDIHIRGIGTTGNNRPLIIVDNIERNNVNQIDPNTIESVTVLKDAAAVAPYGLGGANGVLLITTKRGSSGAPSVSFDTYYGIQTPTYYPDMLGAQDYMRLHNEAYFNSNPNGANPPYDESFITDYPNLNAQDPDRYPITNNAGKKFQDLYAPMQNYNLQLSGGSDAINYYAALGAFNQKGMFDDVSYRRYNFSLKLTGNATEFTKITASLNGSVEKTNDVDDATSTNQLFRAGYKYSPIANLYYSNGRWGEFAGNSPIGILNSGGYSRNDRNTLLTTIDVEQELPFIPGLSIKGVFSYDPSYEFIKGWHRPFSFWSQDVSTSPYSYSESVSTAEGNAPSYTYLRQETNRSQRFTYQGYINYRNSFGDHNFTGLLVAEARNHINNNFSARRDNFAVAIDELNMGSSNKNNFYNGGFSSTGSQAGFVYRLGYNYANKYLFEASGRYDGHYYFAPDDRWGYFPAFSLGWLLSEENFIKDNLDFVEYLKVRGSWGKSGNLAGTGFQYLEGYNLFGDAYAFGAGSMVQGSIIRQESNPNITWEIATKTDIGLETSLWEGLLDLEVDYFFERRTGMLLPPAVTVPVEYGLGLSDENAGIMNNHGIEVTIGTHIPTLDNGLQLGLRGNFSYARNKMEQVFETDATYENPRRRRTGRAYETPFGYKSLGLFTTDDDKNGDGIIDEKDGYNVQQFGELHPGDIKYADLNDDGKIDSGDEVVIGHPIYPAITFGFTPTANWKGFDLSLFFQGSAMSSIDIQGFQTIPLYNNNSNSDYEYYNNRWTPDNQNARYPRATPAPYSNNTQASDFWRVNTSYVRLKTATLGYTLPPELTSALRIQSLRIYFTGQNLFTLSNLKFMDPEVGYDDLEVAYPNQKVYTVGLNINF